MPNYEKTCWYCGSKNMKPVDTWFQCQDCGATHVPHPESLPRYDLYEGHIDKVRSQQKGRRVISNSPTDAVTREAAKARAAKKL